MEPRGEEMKLDLDRIMTEKFAKLYSIPEGEVWEYLNDERWVWGPGTYDISTISCFVVNTQIDTEQRRKLWERDLDLFLAEHKHTLYITLPYEDTDAYVLFSKEPFPVASEGDSEFLFDLGKDITRVYIAPR